MNANAMQGDEDGIVRELRGQHCRDFGSDPQCNADNLCICDMHERAAALIVSQRQEIERVKWERDSLKAFRDYFADRCEGLFFQFGMEVIDLYNATHGYKACHIDPDSAAHPKDAP